VILLDTNVISELMRSEPNVAVERWFLLNEEVCRISTITIGEIAFGIAKLEVGEKKSKLLSQLTEWRVRFAQRTLSFETTAALLYGDLLANARSLGRPMSLPDAQIAAIARASEHDLCTRNTSDFSTTQINLINPWL
jgi:predicted nucleic acid-binding protein